MTHHAIDVPRETAPKPVIGARSRCATRFPYDHIERTPMHSEALQFHDSGDAAAAVPSLQIDAVATILNG